VPLDAAQEHDLKWVVGWPRRLLGPSGCPRAQNGVVTWRDGPVPPTSILVIVDGHEGTQSGIAVLSGLVAGTLSRVSIAGDARTVAPVIEAVGRGERVPVSVERWQIVAGTLPPDPAHPPLA
jgi:hypothetical protein